ncbi:MAG: EAL domain-containing protein [Candidatus Electrothrix sp. AR4]|nr:EAL domain-containing protein [Candidatus Electrothrix sp. AR4]
MLIQNEDILNALDELETNAIIVVDHKGFVQKINKGVTAILGYNANDLIGYKVEGIFPSNLRRLHREKFLHYTKNRKMEVTSKSKLIGAQRLFPEDTIVVGSNKAKRFSVMHKDQYIISISLTINEIWSDSDNLIGFVAIISDNTKQSILQKKLECQANYDNLVGLMSWQEFERRVKAIKKNILENNLPYHASLLFLDVDYFKTLTYSSHRTGEHALKLISTWLLDHTRLKNDQSREIITVRFLGDQFILYLPARSLDSALELSRHLKKEFQKLNLRTAKNPFFTTISIGATEITQNIKLHDAISQALHACNLSKRKGKNKIEVGFYNGSDNLKLERVIRKALQKQRLKLYAQKIVPISQSAKKIDNKRAHYEILSRMEDKHGNSLSPMIFIPAAENLGLAIAIDKYVIEHTLAAIRNSIEHEKSLSLCSINLSGMSVSSEEMYHFIEQQIHLSGINPNKLCFELTETAEVVDTEAALALISNLKRLGCKSAFDDFGIGYSNYQSFSRLPVDIIKIDGSYVRKILNNKQLRTDTEGMINSAKSRKIEIVGEFAETAEIVTELERLGVDYAQGYYFCKPKPLSSFMAGSHYP